MLEAGMVQQFAKRYNSDGTVDSICLNCFRTVATCADELELIEFEKDHRCGQDRAELPESRHGATILKFPPDRMIQNHGSSQKASADAQPAQVETPRERIHSRK